MSSEIKGWNARVEAAMGIAWALNRAAVSERNKVALWNGMSTEMRALYMSAADAALAALPSNPDDVKGTT